MKHMRKSRITKDELAADVIFIFISLVLSFFIVFFFDIHQSFYTWPIHLKFIFTSRAPYYIFTLFGTIIGFVLIKLFVYGLRKEEK